jgi:hypothetical protein
MSLPKPTATAGWAYWNSRTSRVVGWVTTALMTLATLPLLVALGEGRT